MNANTFLPVESNIVCRSSGRAVSLTVLEMRHSENADG
jgi:hypothetical protein